jgi:hypothetical protein
MRYIPHPAKVWIKKDSHAHIPGPKRVSIYGALPSPREAYEMREDGWSIYDSRSNTYSNYFKGKILKTEEEANTIAQELNK